MGWFKVGLTAIIINVVTEMNHRCNYMQVFFKYMYNVKHVCTVSTLYQMIDLNVST